MDWLHLVSLLATEPPCVAFSYFGWTGVEDSSGVNVWAYRVVFESGGWRDVDKSVFSTLISLEFEIMRAVIALSIWFLGYALSFEWLGLLTTPAKTLGDALQTIVDNFGLVPLLLTVVGLICGIWLLRGRFATSLYELMAACLIASISVVLLSNPVERVAGDDGLLMNARDAGLEIAVGLANDGDTQATTASEHLKIIQANLADSMLRRPTQLLNFGWVIDDVDSQPCSDAWTENQNRIGLDDRAAGNIDEDLTAALEESCDQGEAIKRSMENPSAATVFGGFAIFLFGLCFFIFCIAVGGAVFVAAGWGTWTAVKLIVASVAGIVPGAGRDMWWRCLAAVLMAMVMIIFSVAFAVGYMIVVDSFFSSASNPIARFIMVDLALIGGVIVLRSVVKRLRQNSDRLAEKLSSARPGPSGPSRINTSPGLSPLARAAYASHAAVGAGRALKAAGSMGSKAMSPLKAVTPNSLPGEGSGRVSTARDGSTIVTPFKGHSSTPDSARSQRKAGSGSGAPDSKDDRMPPADQKYSRPDRVDRGARNPAPMEPGQTVAPSARSADNPLPVEHAPARPQQDSYNGSRVVERQQRAAEGNRPGIRRPSRSSSMPPKSESRRAGTSRPPAVGGRLPTPHVSTRPKVAGRL